MAGAAATRSPPSPAGWPPKGTITGRVTVAQGGTPLGDTRVIVVGGTAVAATTGEDGRYTLRNVPAGPVDLQVLHVGYTSLKRTVVVTATGSVTDATSRSRIAVAQLEEIVTTATGQQRKVELGNALVDAWRRRQEGRAESPIDDVSRYARRPRRRACQVLAPI